MSETDSNEENNPASMLHGHAAYVAAAAKETIGNMTSSPAWQTSGQDDKSTAVEEMRAAKKESDGQGGTTGNATVGMVEQKLGNVTGCEGMQEDGGAKQS